MHLKPQLRDYALVQTDTIIWFSVSAIWDVPDMETTINDIDIPEKLDGNREAIRALVVEAASAYVGPMALSSTDATRWKIIPAQTSELAKP